MTGGATNLLHAAVVGWAVLRHRELPHGVCTVRWQRGDRTALVLIGARVGDHGTERCLGEIPVAPKGWTDLDHLRGTGQTWLREHLAKVGAR